MSITRRSLLRTFGLAALAPIASWWGWEPSLRTVRVFRFERNPAGQGSALDAWIEQFAQRTGPCWPICRMQELRPGDRFTLDGGEVWVALNTPFRNEEGVWTIDALRWADCEKEQRRPRGAPSAVEQAVETTPSLTSLSHSR